MDISAVLMRRLIRKATLITVGITTLCAFGATALAQQPSSPSHADTQTVSLGAQATRVEDVSLADLDLSTVGGLRVARERLHAMARRICAGHANNPGFAASPNFAACVDSTLAGTLRSISTLRQIHATTRNSVTRAANVSLADLNLSTPEGFRVASERLEAMARRLCAELAQNHDLSYRPNWTACVNDTVAGPLAQAKALAAEKETRTARGLAR
jgi:UrcA family protein